jgi:transcriptional regulator with XRE-family HTH domain
MLSKTNSTCLSCVKLSFKIDWEMGVQIEQAKQLRMENNLSPQVVADRLGISRQMYYLLEKEEYRLNEDYLRVLADFYQCSADYILGRTPLKSVTVADIRTVFSLATHLPPASPWAQSVYNRSQAQSPSQTPMNR